MLKIISVILKKKKYLAIAFSSGLIFAVLTYYLTVINVYQNSIFIFALMNGYFFTAISLLFILATAVLFGVYLALAVFKRDLTKANRSKAAGNKASGLSGTISGILGSGCPSCGAPLLGLVGLPLGLFSLPLKGLELKILGVILITLSIYLITKNIKNFLFCPPAKK